MLESLLEKCCVYEFVLKQPVQDKEYNTSYTTCTGMVLQNNKTMKVLQVLLNSIENNQLTGKDKSRIINIWYHQVDSVKRQSFEKSKSFDNIDTIDLPF